MSANGRTGLLVLAVSVCALAGCSVNANRRLARDLCVVALSPVQVPAGALRDTVRVHIAKPATLFVSPVLLCHHALKHALVTVAHGADIILYPVSVLRDAPPLELYQWDRFPLALSQGTEVSMTRAMVWCYYWPLAGMGASAAAAGALMATLGIPPAEVCLGLLGGGLAAVAAAHVPWAIASLIDREWTDDYFWSGLAPRPFFSGLGEAARGGGSCRRCSGSKCTLP